jgi:hypothetical protein
VIRYQPSELLSFGLEYFSQMSTSGSADAFLDKQAQMAAEKQRQVDIEKKRSILAKEKKKSLAAVGKEA